MVRNTQYTINTQMHKYFLMHKINTQKHQQGAYDKEVPNL